MAKILIVDDDPTVVNSTADMLRAISFEVISATDGRSGYRMAVKEKPDIRWDVEADRDEEYCKYLDREEQKNE